MCPESILDRKNYLDSVSINYLCLMMGVRIKGELGTLPVLSLLNEIAAVKEPSAFRQQTHPAVTLLLPSLSPSLCFNVSNDLSLHADFSLRLHLAALANGHKVLVDAALLHQFFMGSLLRNAAAGDDQYFVGMANGVQPVGDHLDRGIVHDRSSLAAITRSEGMLQIQKFIRSDRVVVLTGFEPVTPSM